MPVSLPIPWARELEEVDSSLFKPSSNHPQYGLVALGGVLGGLNVGVPGALPQNPCSLPTKTPFIYRLFSSLSGGGGGTQSGLGMGGSSTNILNLPNISGLFGHTKSPFLSFLSPTKSSPSPQVSTKSMG